MNFSQRLAAIEKRIPPATPAEEDECDVHLMLPDREACELACDLTTAYSRLDLELVRLREALDARMELLKQLRAERYATVEGEVAEAMIADELARGGTLEDKGPMSPGRLLNGGETVCLRLP